MGLPSRGMNELVDLIREEINAQGPMRFDRFMALALYHLEQGYYARPGPIGRSGDFLTSVSVGPLFGRLLARQFRQMAGLLEEDEFWIIEQGAHDGRLARDILEEWRALSDNSKALRYAIIEPSPAARETQKGLLAGSGRQVLWFERVEDLAEQKPAGVYFSNELVDALPVRLVQHVGGWRERCVINKRPGSFAWAPMEISDDELRAALAELALPDWPNYCTEISLEARRWMRGASACLRRGYIVTIDYGFPASLYYAPFRKEGTLSCYRNHRRGLDVLSAPGEQDVTAHVDFTALAHVGEMAGWTTQGWVDQQHFLTGIVEQENEVVRPAEVRAFQTLTHPDHLGMRFKALVQAKNAPGGLAGLRFARAGQLD